LKLTTDRHDTSRGLSATAQLLVITADVNKYGKNVSKSYCVVTDFSMATCSVKSK